ncbi:glutathione-disulfide reductase [Sphingomonadaceae bacterium G21617-S1]|jgi:glutathione reductase (NADPH)|uniref:glutathione-disulfide reductase n=1 Tax=Rhizorhabdus sp. TaxID=1968843 RepID=UPI0012061C64|nr:glutathione-disulfide reductase [Rhizorhabdus sp.]MBD3760674.1 glutathione-disulfide reductase [Rhizorhabdus sp.]MCZ4342506.1 glutathione-disulfide reductase [Sphingomonadaceae bacterium G21617-S1]TAK10552.1 MAG: glutathione-disulfide reductase [Rhizorhabdus sp.]
MADYDYDLFVIGAGSGGVRASRVAAAYGAKVAVAEEHRIGGTCVIRGCVPKKMLVYGSHFAEDLHDAARYGWTLGETSFDWKVLRDNVNTDVDRIEGLYTNTLDNNKVEIFKERATLSGPNEVTLASGRTVTAKYILIATGAWPVVPQVPGAEHGITSNEVFYIDELPKRVVIAGAGYIANEFAGIFHALGSKVTVVNRSDQILRGYDEQIRDRLFQISTQKGIEFIFNASFEKVEKNEDGTLCVHFKDHEKCDTDLLLYAIGRSPKIEGLGLEKAGVEINEKGAIIVDEDNRSSVPSIYAVGDVTDRVQLTPVAIREGQAFADTLFGGKPHRVDYANIPSAVFSNPPMAGVGLTERQAREQYGAPKIFTSDFRPMRNVLAGKSERSLYKLVVHPETDVVLGIHMISPDAPEILQAAAIAVKAGLTKAQFDDTVALHPSMAEELVLMK